MDIGLGNASADTLLDTVSVKENPLPPPTTLPLTNWDFETSPFYSVGTVSGWTVGGNGNIAVTEAGATTGTHSAAFSAGADSDNDILSQRFYTTSGGIYVLDFDAGIAGEAESTMQLRARAFGDGSAGNALDEIVSPPFLSMQPFHHYSFTFTANNSITILEFSDLLRGNLNSDILLDSVSVAPVPSSFSDWQASHFTNDQLNNPLISGWDADPDMDRIPNGLEYFFHTDPLNGLSLSDANSIPHIAVEQVGANHYLTCTFRRLLGWTGNAALVSLSNDLNGWDTSGNQLEPAGNVVPSGDGFTEIVKVRLKTPIDQGMVPRKFLRLQLSQ